MTQRQMLLRLDGNQMMFRPQRQIRKKQKKKTATTTPAATTPPTTTTTMPWLPHEIIFFHILPKLPVRCLLRFNCVSKLWYDTIHNPKFHASHFTHAKSNPSLVALLCLRDNSLRFLHLEEEEEVGEHHHHNPKFHASVDLLLAYVTVIGNCNGLTCSRLSSTIQIINPSTRELLTLPRPKLSPTTESLCFSVAKHGFGFDPFTNEYKVIQLCIDYHQYYECWVFTLGTNLWRNITPTCNYLPSCYPCDVAPICIGGVLFWMTGRSSKVLLFDLHHEKFQLIPCPQVPRGSIRYSLFDLGGRLCQVYRDDNLIKDGVQLTLYVLKDRRHLRVMHTKQQQKKKASSSSGSWIRLGYSIRLPEKPDTELIKICVFSKQIYLQWITVDGDFMLYNVNRKGSQKKLSDLFRYQYVILVNHVENLLSLKAFVPPSAGDAEVNYVSSMEAVHERPTTSTSCCSRDLQRRELRERKRRRLISCGYLTTPCWVSR